MQSQVYPKIMFSQIYTENSAPPDTQAFIGFIVVIFVDLSRPVKFCKTKLLISLNIMWSTAVDIWTMAPKCKLFN